MDISRDERVNKQIFFKRMRKGLSNFFLLMGLTKAKKNYTNSFYKIFFFQSTTLIKKITSRKIRA